MLPFILPLFLFSPVSSTATCHLESKVLTNLWKVSGDSGPPSYFFGTVHLPYTRVWQGISEQAKTAFQWADHVYLETVEDFDIETCVFIPDNKRLADILSPELMSKLRGYVGWLSTEMPSWLSLIQKIDWERWRPQHLR